ncbi:MAG: hypothetical protein K1X29_00420 [Bdellovibrionales bacterium]|nr:hypothetical protein [Bdellovibrionales bacterium]
MNYSLAIKMEKALGKHRKILLKFGVGFNLLLLIVIKYSSFIVETIVSFLKIFSFQVPNPKIQIHLPLGISFIVFHAISYLIDVYKIKIQAEKKLLPWLYIFFFFLIK